VIYKVSYVVIGGSHPGAIVNQDTPPSVGDETQLDGEALEIVEVVELLPPHNDFAYLHATCKLVEEAGP
jgi:hypothetical protein